MLRLSPFLIFGAAAGVCFAQTTSRPAIARMRDALDARDKARSRTRTNGSGQRVQGTLQFRQFQALGERIEESARRTPGRARPPRQPTGGPGASSSEARPRGDMLHAVQEYRCHIRFEQMGRAEATLNRARTAAARLARLDSYSTPHGLSVDSKAGDAKRALARLESALSPSVSESPSPAGPRGRGVDNEEAVETRIRGTR